MKREIVITADGSKTIHLPELNENYHSHHGALQEAKHVFIKHGLATKARKDVLNVLEIGFGTGLNALLSLDFAVKNNLRVNYFGLEAYPVNEDELSAMDYVSIDELSDLKVEYKNLHNLSWNSLQALNSNFYLNKIQEKLEDFSPSSNYFDLIYFDAFGPRVQNEMWTVEVFEKLFESMRDQAILVTYCAQGQVKRNMKAAGFKVEALAGPPGKREMTRAVKLL